MRQRRTASVERHEISRDVPECFSGSESGLDRARFLENAAVALEGPRSKSSADAFSEEGFRVSENKRQARALFHYAQN